MAWQWHKCSSRHIILYFDPSETLLYTTLLYSVTALPVVDLSCVTWVSSLSMLLKLSLRHSDKWDVAIKC